MTKSRRALVTGVLGQDGTYLSRFLQTKNYEVIGTARERPKTGRRGLPVLSPHTPDDFENLVRETQPHEVYLLAAHHQSSQGPSRAGEPFAALPFIDTNIRQPHMLLEALRKFRPEAKVFVAGSCHMLGETKTSPQTEDAPFQASNFYGMSKIALWQTAKLIARNGGPRVRLGILYNHESPLRANHFLSARIAKAAALASLGRSGALTIGSLEAQVDWGYAPEYVEAMWSILQNGKETKYIIGSGALHTVRDFVEEAFRSVGLDWKDFVHENAMAYSPIAKAVFFGDTSRIQNEGLWAPRTRFSTMVREMVEFHKEVESQA